MLTTEKQDINNSKLLKYYCKVVNWIKDMAVKSQKNNVLTNQESLKCGLAETYCALYTLLKLQAKAFLIPLKIVGLDDLEEKDLLSLSLIQGEKSKMSDNIPKKYIDTVIGWMSDNIYFIKEYALDEKKDFEKQIGSNSENKDDLRFKKGLLNGYYDTISYMQKQAKELGLSLEDVNLHDIDPDKDLIG